jgi:hypothetical protein
MRPRGITWSKVAQWLWVLSGPTPNEMTERLLSKPFHRKEILKPTHRPPFILLEILRRDISKVKTLEMLISYTRDHVLNLVDTPRSSVPKDQAITSAVFKGTSESDDASSLRKNQRRTITKSEKFGIEENAFAILISRLLYQTRRIWPSAMVDIAHLIVRYMQSSSVTNVSPLNPSLFIRFCKMNNYFLRLLALPSSIEPMQSMAYNWEAQKLLLELAGQFDPPLRLDQASYRAVVQVLAATKKSRRESRSMTFRNRSWPPWRVEQDGMDAQRSQEEDFSRVISAIMRSRESGYTQDDQLSIFGGVDTDGTPTIHTRKLLKSRSLDSSTRARDNHDDEGRVWAARIEATRDVYEGWGAFSEFCKKGGRPTISMYLAMFQKINYESKRSALQLDLHVPPGDAREVYPVSDDNFSEFYKSRLQPPTIQNLYQEMRAAGIVPSGRCLRFLLQHARTVDEGLGYLLDSGIHERVVAYLANGGESQIPPDVVAQVSIPILADFISLICRFAPRLKKTSFDSELEMAEDFRSPTKRNSSPARSESWTIREARAIQHSHPRDPLTHAAFLLKSWRPKFRPAWYALLKCLARKDIVMVRNLVTDSSRTCDNHELAWRVTRAVLEDFHSCDLELDPEGFRLVCQTFTKYAEAAFNESQRHREGLIETSQIIKAECAKLTNGGVEVPSKVNTRLRYIVEGAHLHAYVRAMGLIGDHAAITSLLEWMVRNHEELDAIASLAANGQRMLRQTIVAIKAFCDISEHAVATAQPLVEQVESWGGWPGEEEVEYYLNRGHDQVQGAGAEPDDDEEDD